MPKSKSSSGWTAGGPLHAALDAVELIGSWDWHIPADRVCTDAFCAFLFNVGPDEAEDGVPLSRLTAGMHGDDRERVGDLICKCMHEGGSYIAEYRVLSADGTSRWVLARGRFYLDHEGRPLRGQGVVIDITQNRTAEDAYALRRTADEPPLDRATEHLLAAHTALKSVEDPELLRLAELLLFELGRKIAKAESQGSRKRMN